MEAAKSPEQDQHIARIKQILAEWSMYYVFQVVPQGIDATQGEKYVEDKGSRYNCSISLPIEAKPFPTVLAEVTFFFKGGDVLFQFENETLLHKWSDRTLTKSKFDVRMAVTR